MALGALAATPGLKVQIIPTGLSYFHPHRFRSRAVVEFGTPITIPQELVDDFVKGGATKRAAISKTLDLVFDGLKSVTVRAPDYETLMVCQCSASFESETDIGVACTADSSYSSFISSSWTAAIFRSGCRDE